MKIRKENNNSLDYSSYMGKQKRTSFAFLAIGIVLVILFLGMYNYFLNGNVVEGFGLFSGKNSNLNSITGFAVYQPSGIINIDFGYNHIKKIGPAAVGNQGDYWTTILSQYYQNVCYFNVNDANTPQQSTSTLYISNLSNANKQNTSISLRILACFNNTYAGGSNRNWTDKMFDTYGQKHGKMSIYLSNFSSAGVYDLYIYGQGGIPGQYGNYSINVSGGALQWKATSRNSSIFYNNTNWTENDHYVKFSGVSINPGQTLEIITYPTFEGYGWVISPYAYNVNYSIINGIQLVNTASSCNEESNAQFCTRLGKNCGSVTAADNCGISRTVTCGTCSGSDTCGGSGTANVCGTCALETDTQFCTRLGKNCGSVTNTDLCGVSRTVTCGTCSGSDTCGGGGTTNVCGTCSETDAQMCTRLGKNCGSVTATNICGASKTVTCGTCAQYQTCGGGGVTNVCTPPFPASSNSTKEDIIKKLAVVQLLTPQLSFASILYGTKEVKGVSLSNLNLDSRNIILQKLFGNSNAKPGANASVFVNGVNYTALLIEGSGQGQNQLEIVIYGANPNGISMYPDFMRVPFLKKGIALPVNQNVCLNGILEGSEQCEILPGVLLSNNPSSLQSEEICLGSKIAKRNVFGGCSINCKAIQTIFDEPRCEKGSCGATCSTDSDCSSQGAGWTCSNSCSCSPPGSQFCGDNKLSLINGEQCEKDSDCSVSNQKCVSCSCVQKSFCGDGILQNPNDDGINEECDFNSLKKYTSCGVSNVGQCRKGVSICNDQCSYSRQCVGEVLPDLVETCGDGIDNNCNGENDEGCTCTNGNTLACGSNVGACKQGIMTCSEGVFGVCTGEIGPSDEICDGIDNNCNGLIDEGLRNFANECGANTQPEKCDGIDNNENGEVDEGGVCQIEGYKICIDSDPDNDLFSKGNVNLKDESFSDSCEEDTLSVREYFCFGNTLKNFVKRCPYGSTCLNGACSSSETNNIEVKCFDTDEADDLDVKGYVTYNDNTFIDTCEEVDLSVRQYSCSEDELNTFVKRCPSGTYCNYGACISN